jgi:hypothetical protein
MTSSLTLDPICPVPGKGPGGAGLWKLSNPLRYYPGAPPNYGQNVAGLDRFNTLATEVNGSHDATFRLSTSPKSHAIGVESRSGKPFSGLSAFAGPEVRCAELTLRAACLGLYEYPGGAYAGFDWKFGSAKEVAHSTLVFPDAVPTHLTTFLMLLNLVPGMKEVIIVPSRIGFILDLRGRREAANQAEIMARAYLIGAKSSTITLGPLSLV